MGFKTSTSYLIHRVGREVTAFVLVSNIFLTGILYVPAHAAPENIAATPIARLDQTWWRARFYQKARELRAAPVNLLWLGDSITQDWELRGQEPWRNFTPIWQRFYGDRHAVNLGFKGDSTCHLLWRLQHGELSGIAPKGVILLIGANNFGHIHTDAQKTAEGIQAVIYEIHKQLPMTQILLLGVLPSIRSAWVSDNTARLDMVLPKAVVHQRSYVTYVDLGSLFFRDGHVDPEKFLDTKLIPPGPPLHPTAQTQERMAIAIEPLVARMLGDSQHR